MKIYRNDLDILKGILIISVVLYHIGVLSTGYLGVDAFFVINGFLIIPSLINKVDKETNFSIVNYILHRVIRLWPLTLLASAISLIVGLFGMLPDDFENLSQSVVATSFMSQNILSAITTGNYWDVVNDYKPLMHFWYVGVLVQFYVIFPFLIVILHKISKILKLKYLKFIYLILFLLFLLSLFLYLNPNISSSHKFYFLPFRLFELLAGGLVGVLLTSKRITNAKFSRFYSYGFLFILLAMILGDLYIPSNLGPINPVSGQMQSSLIINKSILLLLTVLATSGILVFKLYSSSNIMGRYLINIGKMSFSIFVWHQVLLAFYRYYFSSDISFGFIFLFLLFTFLISYLSYNYIEQVVKPTYKAFFLCCILSLFLIIPSMYIYMNAGIIRDVPELEIYKNDGRRGMFAEYCDRVYKYDKDFTDSNKVRVLVEGVSFGRDFANILLESEISDVIELSYIFKHDEKYLIRYKQCDLLFTFNDKDEVPDYVWDNVPKQNIYGLGPKNFGVSNGVIYRRRNSDNYHSLTVDINPNFYIINNEWKNNWGSNYIDFIDLSTSIDGKISVFSDDGLMISQDCRHLTQGGAKHFASKINWSKLITSQID